MIAAGLVAKKAVERGLSTKPWVKASLAPGSKVVTDYLNDAGLTPTSTSCGSTSSATAARPASATPAPCRPRSPRRSARTTSSRPPSSPGNRNFEGRINSDVKRQLPGLAPAGRRLRPGRDDGHRPPDRPPRARTSRASPSTSRTSGRPVREVADVVGRRSVRAEMFHKEYGEVFQGDERWNSLDVPTGDLYEWDDASTYVKNPPYFDGMPRPAPAGPVEIKGRPRPGRPGRQHHDRPHLARRLDQGPGPRRPLPDRARGRRDGLQLVRVAARQPRGDGPRHVRQHPPAQPARPRHRGRRHPPPPRRRGDDHLRRLREISRRGRPPDHPGGQGIRLGLVARLGRQGARSCWASGP